MPEIVEFPSVVRQAMEDFGDLFWCEPQRKHFAEFSPDCDLRCHTDPAY